MAYIRPKLEKCLPYLWDKRESFDPLATSTATKHFKEIKILPLTNINEMNNLTNISSLNECTNPQENFDKGIHQYLAT